MKRPPSAPANAFAQTDAANLHRPLLRDDPSLSKIHVPSPRQENDPKFLLRNLMFLEQKVHQLQGVVCSMIREEDDPYPTAPIRWPSAGGRLAQQQIVAADTASIVSQVISTAARVLQGMEEEIGLPGLGQLTAPVAARNGISGSAAGVGASSGDLNGCYPKNPIRSPNLTAGAADGRILRSIKPIPIEAENPKINWEEKSFRLIRDGAGFNLAGGNSESNDSGKDRKDQLSTGCYEVLEVAEEEILAPHSHFCSICGKGFKRDANLRMHMRGHGDMYKTVEALSNPNKKEATKMAVDDHPAHSRRYSCPFEGCKRNRKHRKFQPLKTILCVKNHYKRTHCSKSYTCRRCNRKKFSVIADLKTHEKHCGEDKWRCSCGTTFSRKDKLLGHVALFQGHSPVIPVKASAKSDDGSGSSGLGSATPNCGSAKLIGGGGISQQTVPAEAGFNGEENDCNYSIDVLAYSSPDLPDSAFSFNALLSRDFVEANLRDPDISDS